MGDSPKPGNASDRTSAALAACEARYRTLFEHVQVGVVLADSASRYIDANEAACAMLGYSREEFIGLHATDIVIPQEAGEVGPALREIHSRRDHRREWLFRRKDGSIVAADVLATQMPDGTLLGILRDLSDQHRAQQYLEHLAAIVQSSADGIIGTDLDGMITSWNPGAESIFGFRADAIVGQPISRLLPAGRNDEGQLIIDRLRRGEVVDILDTERQRSDATLVDVSLAISPIRGRDGEIVGASTIARDISGPKAREVELARLSRLYAALSQVNQAIVWARDRDGLFQRICTALVEHGGLRMAWIGWYDKATGRISPVAERGDDTGSLHQVTIHGDGRPGSESPSSLAFQANQAWISNDTLEEPVLRRWRDELAQRGFLSCACFPVRLGGQPAGVLSVYADRTGYFQDREVELLAEAATDLSFALDNLARERALRSEKAFSDTMIESTPGIFYFYDANGTFLRWNRNFEVVSGCSGEELATMHPLDFFRGEDRERVRQRIAEVFSSGESSVEADFISRDGTATPYFFTGRRVLFDGRACLVGVGMDISRRRETELRLADSERKYRELVEHANSIILRWDAQGRVSFLNEFGQRFFGYGEDEILGCHVLETLVPDTETTGRDLRELMDQILADPAAFEQNVNENIRRNGERVWISWTNRIIRDEAGRLVEILSVGTDVTDRLRVEAERERRHRAEAADRVKSAFLATMSHELRTPLNSIIGFTGILLQGLAGPLNEEQGRQMEMVQGSARHLLALVNDVLDISKIEAGQFDVAREPFDLAESVMRVVALVRPRAQARGLGLEVELDPGIGAACGDQRRVEQVLLNLLSNAVKFTPQGRVTLRAMPIEGRPGWIRLEVSDTGIGIRSADLAELFQPFRQLESGLARNFEGTGLGLAISSRLAELMGGSIHVASQLGQGSTFTVELPLQTGEAHEPPHTAD